MEIESAKLIAAGIAVGFGAIGQSVFESIKDLISTPNDIDLIEIDFKNSRLIQDDNQKPYLNQIIAPGFIVSYSTLTG